MFHFYLISGARQSGRFSYGGEVVFCRESAKEAFALLFNRRLEPFLGTNLSVRWGKDRFLSSPPPVRTVKTQTMKRVFRRLSEANEEYWKVPPFHLKDGAVLSIQGSPRHFALPGLEEGVWEHLELMFLEGSPLHPRLEDHRDGDQYGFVPSGLVLREIEAHGGLM